MFANHQQQRGQSEALGLQLELEGRLGGNPLDPRQRLQVTRKRDARSHVFWTMQLEVRKIGNAECLRIFLSPGMPHVDKGCGRWLMKASERRDGRGDPNACSMGQAVHHHSF